MKRNVFGSTCVRDETCRYRINKLPFTIQFGFLVTESPKVGYIKKKSPIYNVMYVAKIKIKVFKSSIFSNGVAAQSRQYVIVKIQFQKPL